MKIKTINYEKVFPLAPYQNEKIGVEIEVEEKEDENVVFAAAKMLVQKWHTGEIKPINQEVPIQSPTALPEINLNDEKIEIAIDNAKTVEELNTLMNSLPLHLEEHFKKRLNELSK